MCVQRVDCRLCRQLMKMVTFCRIRKFSVLKISLVKVLKLHALHSCLSNDNDHWSQWEGYCCILMWSSFLNTKEAEISSAALELEICFMDLTDAPVWFLLPCLVKYVLHCFLCVALFCGRKNRTYLVMREWTLLTTKSDFAQQSNDNLHCSLLVWKFYFYSVAIKYTTDTNCFTVKETAWCSGFQSSS